LEYKIIEIKDNIKKSEYTDIILRKLPEWFGNENSIKNYVETVCELPFWAAFDNNNCIGFFSCKIHYNRTGDIYVCGIDPKYHGKGIGALLYMELEKYCIKNGCEYIIIKTLSEIAEYEPYSKTKKFYLKMGFKELLTLTEMWDENSPCLIMIKVL
jgi:ribosomal protein S18 acetylase RimI-like enzyme